MVFAVDFDGTIVENKFPQIGEIKPGAIETLKALQQLEHKLILWTCRKDAELQEAVAFLISKGIKMDAVNQNVDEDFTGRKIFAHVYIDDRSFPPFMGWEALNDYFIKDLDSHGIYR